ncbi:hypothetical protein OROMI_009172 [Orobanche minor]
MGSRLTSHDKKITNISLLLNSLAEKFSKFETKQDDVLKILERIDSRVSCIDDARKGEEAREAARCWRIQKEEEMNSSLDDSVAAVTGHLDSPTHGYRISWDRPEFHDPNFSWKNIVLSPTEIKLPTDRQPTAGEVKRWRKNELLRYFVKLIRESTLFNKFRTLKDAAEEYAKFLEKGLLPLQMSIKSKHMKGDQVTHPEDWILAFEKSAEGRAIYLNRGKDALGNW